MTWLAVGAVAVAASIVLRRAKGGVAPGVTASIVTGFTALLGWGVLIVLAILGIPLGA